MSSALALIPPTIERTEAVRACRAALRRGDADLRDRYERGEAAQALVGSRAETVDRVVLSAWHRHVRSTLARACLVAVGGYGRGELHPASDADILILLGDPADHRAQDAIRELVAFLWDIGLQVGHSVRTVEQCVADARDDVTIATSFMEARRLDGPSALFERMRIATGSDRLWSSRAFFEAKRAEQNERHHRFNDTAYNLEPNVKEGPGGLRDIQMVGWVAKRHFGADTLGDLVTHGFLTEREYATLAAGQAFLWRVRLALHLIAGRREDRLQFDHQRTLAAQFGYRDDDASLAVEKFMKQYYRWIMELSRLNEMLLELFLEAIPPADATPEVIVINPRFRAVSGFLEVTDERVFETSPFALLELFLVLQQRPELKGVRASTIRLVRDHRHLIDEGFRADPRAQALFLEILRQPRGITHELRRMNRYGVLAQYLPVFGAVVGQMQHDLFHAYTVDEHSLFVLSNLRAFAVERRRHEFPLCSEIFERLAKPELLYIAGLFHDIAKGRGSDHCELGARFAREFCAQHRLSRYDERLVSWLVRHHLLMSITAQRRDIADPEVIGEFARQVGDQTRLDHLYLLTVADIRATNTRLWNDWKDTLLRDLYIATERALRRGLANPADRDELIAESQVKARHILGDDAALAGRAGALWSSIGEDYFLRYWPEEIAWHARGILTSDLTDRPLVLVRQGRGGTEVFVYTADQKYLFAASTSVLDRLGLTILNARIVTADNAMTLDSYVVSELDGNPVADPSRVEEIQQTLRDTLRDPRSARRLGYRRLARRQLRHFDFPVQVSYDVDERNRRTVLEVIATDRPGLLAHVGWTLADCEVRLQNAKIATFGERAEDVFFVTDASDRPLETAALEQLRARLIAAIDQ